MSADLLERLHTHPTMYAHDCISNIVETEPQLLSIEGCVFEPPLDRIQREIEELTAEERALLVEWLTAPEPS